MHVGPNDRQHDARHATTGADVEDPIARLRVAFENSSVSTRSRAYELLVVGVPRQVQLLIPLPHQSAILVDLRDCSAGNSREWRDSAAASVSLRNVGEGSSVIRGV